METFSELFYQDAYISEFDAEVISCRENKGKYEIVLSDTAFYPEGGGQPGDIGCLKLPGADGEEAIISVLDTRKKDGSIVHITEKPVEEGQKVHGSLDWDNRFAHMQGHSGEHIISGLICSKFGLDNVGFHLGDRIRIDFNGVLTWEELEERERKANELIWANIPIKEMYPTEEELKDLDYRSKKELEGAVRIVEIEGGDRCACCGTHVRTTGEIGLIKCLTMIHYKGGVRIELLAGKPALDYVQQLVRQNTEISRLLSAKPEETVEAVDKLKAENLNQKMQTVDAMNLYFQAREELLEKESEAGSKLLIDLEPGLNMADVRRFCDRLLKAGRADVVAVLAPKNREDLTEGYNFTIGSQSTDLKAAAKTLNAALNGRGGGSKEMIQGTFLAEEGAIREKLQEMFA